MPPAATEATPTPATGGDDIHAVVPLRRTEFSVANPGGRLFVFDGARGVPIAQIDVPPSGSVSADLPAGAHEVLIADRPDRARTSYRTRAAIVVPAAGRPASAPIQLDARVQDVTVTIQLPPKTPLGVDTAQRGGIDLANLRRDDDPDWHLAPDVTTDLAAAEVQLRFANLGPGQYTLELPPCLHFASGSRPATWTVPGPAAHTLDFRTP